MMENKKSKTIIIALLAIVVIICIIVVCILLGKSSKEEKGTIAPNQYEQLDYSYKDSFSDDNGEVKIINGKIYYSFENNTDAEVATKENNIVSVALTSNCGGPVSIVYLTSDNKLYSRDVHQTDISEKDVDVLKASDATGFALVDWNDPNDTCGGQDIVYKDVSGNIKKVQ